MAGRRGGGRHGRRVHDADDAPAVHQDPRNIGPGEEEGDFGLDGGSLAGGEPFHLSGTFLEIGPPGRLAYTFSWDKPAPDDRETVVTLMLHAHDGGTRVSLSHGLFATEERLALHRNGWTESFEKLREVLTARG